MAFSVSFNYRYLTISILLTMLTDNFQQLLTTLAVNGTAITKITALIEQISLMVKKSLIAQPLTVLQY